MLAYLKPKEYTHKKAQMKNTNIPNDDIEDFGENEFNNEIPENKIPAELKNPDWLYKRLERLKNKNANSLMYIKSGQKRDIKKNMDKKENLS